MPVRPAVAASFTTRLRRPGWASGSPTRQQFTITSTVGRCTQDVGNVNTSTMATRRGGRARGFAVAMASGNQQECRGDVATAVSQRRIPCLAGTCTRIAESHTERGGAKLEHGKECNVTERHPTALNGTQRRCISWGTWVFAGGSPLWTGSVRVRGSSPLSSTL